MIYYLLGQETFVVHATVRVNVLSHVPPYRSVIFLVLRWVLTPVSAPKPHDFVHLDLSVQLFHAQFTRRKLEIYVWCFLTIVFSFTGQVKFMVRLRNNVSKCNYKLRTWAMRICSTCNFSRENIITFTIILFFCLLRSTLRFSASFRPQTTRL